MPWTVYYRRRRVRTTQTGSWLPIANPQSRIGLIAKYRIDLELVNQEVEQLVGTRGWRCLAVGSDRVGMDLQTCRPDPLVQTTRLERPTLPTFRALHQGRVRQAHTANRCRDRIPACHTVVTADVVLGQQQDAAQIEAIGRRRPHELAGFEALQIGIRRGRGEAAVRKHCGDQLQKVAPVSAVPVRFLDFRVDTGAPPGRAIQAGDELDFLAERDNPEAIHVAAETIRELRGIGARFASLNDAQLPQLRKIEVDDVMTPVLPRPARKPDGNVGDVIEVRVVEHDQLVVAGRYDILLDEVGTETVGERFGGQ